MAGYKILSAWRRRAGELRREVRALALACRDPRVPWGAKLLAGGVVAYAVSPLDLIPDFIPVLGYLDDLVLLPLGIVAVVRMIPPAVLAECRVRAAEALPERPSWRAAAVIVAIWLFVAAGAARLVLAAWRTSSAAAGGGCAL